MIAIDTYMAQLVERLRERFGEALVYVGLQGSYLRGEATENSDIDAMVVLETLDVQALEAYREVVQSLGDFDKSCGFLCSRADLAAWNPLEMCHLVHSTKDVYGVLRELIPPFTAEDVRCFVTLSVNNLYHEICHRYVHTDATTNAQCLTGTYKSVFFILQNVYYLAHGVFVPPKRELLPLLSGRDRAALQRAIDRQHGTITDFQEDFELLLLWCQETIQAMAR